jgi:uncharacterized protein YfaP (DUF2135 family)
MSSLLALSMPTLAADVQLHTPRGGWNMSGLVDDSEQVASAYPYNLIDRGQQKYRTLIKGQLERSRQATANATANARGTKAPYTLVVNGNPMPLYTGPDGAFVRPYAFGPGSNSIEIKAPPGQRGQRVQFYERNQGRPRAAMRVILSWSDNQAEVDLHVVTPDGQHAFWAHPVLQGGGGLDVDSVDGAGPEMFSITAPRPGVYHFYVNYWGNFGEGGYHFDENTRQKPVITVQMTVITRENTPEEKRETITLPLRNIGDLIAARSLAWR